MQTDEIKIEEQPVKKKRGRKPKNPEDKIYFSDKQEQAVIDYIQNRDDSMLRNRLYVQILKPAFEKMIESIIRTYRLYVPDEDFNDTVNDALNNLAEQIDKFKINSGKKAYSYYGTIVKHYVLKRKLDYINNIEKKPSFDSFEDGVIQGTPISDTYEKDKRIAQYQVMHLIKRIKKMVNNSQEEGLKKNEIKLGLGLINLLENWENIVPTSVEKVSCDGEIKYLTPSKKLNKSAVLLYLKEQTGLDSKSIRSNMKKYKKEFLLIKDYVFENY
jgi:hypothetical protein